MDTTAGPKACRVGCLPSSCQLTVADLPPVKVVEAVGFVTKTLAKADAESARATKVEESIVDGFYALLKQTNVWLKRVWVV